jgi:hypothetical protein
VGVVAEAGIGEWRLKFAPTNGSAGLRFFCCCVLLLCGERVLDDLLFFEFLRAAL